MIGKISFGQTKRYHSIIITIVSTFTVFHPEFAAPLLPPALLFLPFSLDVL